MVEGKAGSMSKDKKPVEKKGKVHKIYTDKGIFPLSVLSKFELDEKQSQQLEESENEFVARNNLKPLPFSANALLDLKDNCPYFDASVKQIAQDVIGQGWRLTEIEEDKGDKTEKIKANEFLKRVNNDNESIENIIYKNMIDWGSIGWFTIEVSRDSSDEINGLWQMPSQTIRIHKDKKKLAQVRGDKKRWFKLFGEEEDISAKTGEPIKTRKGFANEAIYRLNYWPQSTYYGAPNVLSAVGSVFSLIGARDYNLSFFQNYGIPAALVILEGDWEENSNKLIRDFLDTEIKGTENAHKTLVLELPHGGSVEWQPLSVKEKEGSFLLYNKDMRNEVLVAYKMPPYRIGIVEVGSLGTSVARDTNIIYADSIIGPLKLLSAEMITSLILKQGLGIETWKFEWNPLETRDFNELAKRWALYFGMGAINPNWIRNQLGLEPREDELGDQYYIESRYIPVGEESVEKRNDLINRELEAMKAEIDESLEKIRLNMKKEEGN